MATPLHPVVQDVTRRIAGRSRDERAAYLERIDAARSAGRGRAHLMCGNLAHAFAASPQPDKARVIEGAPNAAIVTAYNDMLSAHQPFEHYPELLRAAARARGASAQVAGGVPAMCDGVTQGQTGMELSLFSRDIIAMATGIALSHDVFDAVVCLGTCDKIVPGLLIGALSFGHLPVVFAAAGPMPTGLANDEKARIRTEYAEGRVGRDKLLEAETRSYHTAGTCTFYGTANSNQMMMEAMGLHVPGAAFVNPGGPLRAALTARAMDLALDAAQDETLAMGRLVDERAIVNAMVALLATGGSTNHTIHIPAFARAAGLAVLWDDFTELSAVTPQITRIYPNGYADVNHFHAAGGTPFVIRELISAGLLHADIATVTGQGLAAYAQEPLLQDGALVWRDAPAQTLDRDVLRPVSDPFDAEGGLRVLDGPLGRAIIKTSAVPPDDRVIEAPAVVFDDQESLREAIRTRALDRDVVAVVRFQGPRANGMPELHGLTPALSGLRARGRKVGLVTDGRMSGASGKIAAAIHLSPEGAAGGAIAKIRDGDIVRIDSRAGRLEVMVDPAEFAARAPAIPDLSRNDHGTGREMFAELRGGVGDAESGASLFRGRS
jgi:phosphogluconate dehydratase